MLVRMISTSAGPDGVRLAGETIDVDDAVAADLIRDGYADPAALAPIRTADIVQPEAAVGPNHETADASPRETRRRRR